MPRQAAKNESLKDFPEFPVKREVICSMFTPPLPKSTFYDRVNEGKIIPMPKLSGYYLLNASLHRLGLPLVKELPAQVGARSLEDITRLAFTLIDPALFPPPPWLLLVEAVDARDWDHAKRIADQNRDKIALMEHVHLKLGYFGGVLDAAVLAEQDMSQTR